MHRFTQVDPIKDGLNWYGYVGNNPVNYVDPLGLEKIVVSGGIYKQSKKDEGEFYYEFIEPAIKQLNTYAKSSYGETITWIIADVGWTSLDKDNFRRAMEVNFSGGVNIKYINTSEELIDYYNNMDCGDRSSDKITGLSFFSHGIPDNICWALLTQAPTLIWIL